MSEGVDDSGRPAVLHITRAGGDGKSRRNFVRMELNTPLWDNQSRSRISGARHLLSPA